ncbi:MAG: arginine N-succinyltransferase, partial [Bdellovibrionales bacterium]
MSIYLRQSRMGDLDDLYKLASQFVLLNLPANKSKLKEILELSEASFKKELPAEEREFLFVAEDTELRRVIGASKIVTKHGTEDNPHLFYKIEKREKFSSELGLGFIHQLLSFKEDYDGPTELGGLIVDREYRRRPEKVGKTISLVRFMFIAANREQFDKNLHCELAPPLTAEGRSEFWEALGRRFTGLPYEEADRLSHTNKEFIKSLFPEDKIYMTLLESKARLVVGEVGEETRPARALMEKLGFVYKNEIDPFDGGPHLGVPTLSLIHI